MVRGPFYDPPDKQETRLTLPAYTKVGTIAEFSQYPKRINYKYRVGPGNSTVVSFSTRFTNVLLRVGWLTITWNLIRFQTGTQIPTTTGSTHPSNWLRDLTFPTLTFRLLKKCQRRLRTDPKLRREKEGRTSLSHTFQFDRRRMGNK